jgi:hypothetical protein
MKIYNSDYSQRNLKENENLMMNETRKFVLVKIMEKLNKQTAEKLDKSLNLNF